MFLNPRLPTYDNVKHHIPLAVSSERFAFVEREVLEFFEDLRSSLMT
jgi:hypothetical protein